MKSFLFFITFLFFISFRSYADAPSIYIKITDSIPNTFIIETKIFWNVGLGFPESEVPPPEYFSGKDKTIVKNFYLGKNKIRIEAYFPKSEGGHRLNETTTVFLKIFLNEQLILDTKHFGQHTAYFVTFDEEILCRPNHVKLELDKEAVSMKIKGEFNTDSYDIEDKEFALNYDNNFIRTKTLNDKMIATDVLEIGAVPPTLTYVDEVVGVGKNGNATYYFHSDVNNPNQKDSYEWDNSFYIFTEKTTESILDDLFPNIQHEYKAYKNSVSFKLNEPTISFFSNEIIIDPKNIVQSSVDKYSYTMSNITENYTVKKGVKILNPIKRRSLKISFIPNLWIIDSVHVSPKSIRTSREDNEFTFTGEGIENIDYTIFVRQKPNFVRTEKENDIVVYNFKEGNPILKKRSQIKNDQSPIGLNLENKKYLMPHISCDESDLSLNFYVNNFLYLENYTLKKGKGDILPIPLDSNISEIEILNNSDFEQTFQLSIEDIIEKKVYNKFTFTLDKKQTLVIPFNYTLSSSEK